LKAFHDGNKLGGLEPLSVKEDGFFSSMLFSALGDSF